MAKTDFDPELADISAKDLFWKKCAMDSGHRTGILVLYFAIPVAIVFILSVAASVVLTSLDDVEEAKQVVALEQARQEALDKYIVRGMHPALAKCMVADDRSMQILECYKIIGRMKPADLLKNPAGEQNVPAPEPTSD